MTDIRNIPLAALHVSPNNPRKTGGTDVADLMASIEAENGLLANLVISPGASADTFYVDDGGRRLRALQQLHEAGRLPASLTDGIPCRLVDAENGTEAGLHANLIRMAMHPADEFTAFQKLVEQRRSVTEIAERFGKSEQHIRQRLRLAKVRPEYVQLYRDGEMSLAQLEALASTTNHDLQRQAWETARGDWERDPRSLRRFLSRDAVAGDSPLAQFVGIEAYEAAGGGLRRDLFTNEVWLLDPPLLDKLAMDAMHAKAEELKAAGWSFADVAMPDGGVNPHDYNSHPGQHNYTEVFASAEDAARFAELEQRESEIEDLDADELSEAEQATLSAELDAVQSELEAIRDRIIEQFPPEVMAQSGAVVSIAHDGGLRVSYARLKPGQKAGKPSPTGKADGKPKAKPIEYSQAVLTQLSAHRSLAAQVAIAGDVTLAHSLLIASLLGSHNGLGIHASDPRDARDTAKDVHKESHAALAAIRKHLGTAVPKKDTLAFLLKQTDDWRAEILTMIVAVHFDGIVNSARPHATVDAVHARDKFDMDDTWNPGCEEFLARIHADLRGQAVTEACGKDAAATLAGLKKADHVAATAKLLANTGWLPKPLRGDGYALKKPAAAPKSKGTAKPAAKPKPAKKTAQKKASVKKPAKKTAKAGAK